MDQIELHFTSKECDISYNVSLNAVQTRWKGFYVSGKDLYIILDSVIALMKLKKSPLVIADAREMKIISGEDQKWIVQDWYPRALEAGFRYEALIVSKNTFNELTVKKIVGSYDEEKLKTEYFITPEEALEWAKGVMENSIE